MLAAARCRAAAGLSGNQGWRLRYTGASRTGSAFLSSNQRYSTGTITSVSSVEVIRPPITTTASGRCTSERAVGEQEGHRAQHGDGGRHHHRAEALGRAQCHGLGHRHAGFALRADVGHQHYAVQHRHAPQGDKAHRGRHRQVLAGDEQADHAADRGERQHGDDQRGRRSELNSRNSRKKIAAMVTGTMIFRWPMARSMFWNWPPHSR